MQTIFNNLKARHKVTCPFNKRKRDSYAITLSFSQYHLSPVPTMALCRSDQPTRC